MGWLHAASKSRRNFCMLYWVPLCCVLVLAWQYLTDHHTAVPVLGSLLASLCIWEKVGGGGGGGRNSHHGCRSLTIVLNAMVWPTFSYVNTQGT